MTMSPLLRSLAISSCAVLVQACAALGSPATPIEEFTDRLTPDEERQAISIAEKALQAAEYRSTGKALYAVAVEIIRAKESDEQRGKDRKALVTHYQYDGDMAIFSTVNFSRSVVDNIERVPHVPVPLSMDEFERAKMLAANHPDVKREVDRYRDRLTIEALLARSEVREDPLYGHRVVSLLFRVGSDYLARPEVIVDLTTEKVIVMSDKSLP
jgi:hypothetical protein